MPVLTATTIPGITVLSSQSGATLIYDRATSLYREQVLFDDPLLFFSMDPDTFVLESTARPTLNLARRNVDNLNFPDSNSSNTLRRVFTSPAGVFAYPTSSAAGLEFDGASAMALSLAGDSAPGPWWVSPARSARRSEIIRNEELVSLEVWLKYVTSTNGDMFPVCVGGGLLSGVNGVRFAGTRQGSQFTFQFQDTTSTVRTATKTGLTLIDNAWHHFVGTWDGTDLKLYIDGDLEATTTPPGGTEIRWSTTTSGATNDSGFILKAGAAIRDFVSSTPISLYVGFMKNVALYNYPLTATQVTTHYTVGSGSGFNSFVPPQPFPYGRAEFPPHPTGNTYDVLERAVTTVTTVTSGGWKDSDGASISGDADNFAVTVRVPKDANLSASDRKIDFVAQLTNGADDSLIQFGLCYDPRFVTSGKRAVKFAVHNGTSVTDALYAREAGGFASFPTVAGTWDFEWEQSVFYRFNLVDTGTGIALYLNDVLVKEYTVTPSGFNIESLALRTEDWQNYIDPIVQHDWLVFRADQGADEFSLTSVTTNLNSSDWYESQTRDAVRISDYILRHRVHTPMDQANASDAYSFTLNDALFARRPTLANSSSVEWIPVNNTKDWV